MNELTIDELHQLRLRIFDNAESLHKEALLLLENGFHARAYLLAYFSSEELGKIAANTFKATTRELKGFDTFQRSHNVTSRLLLTTKTPAMSAIPFTVTKQQKFDNRRKLLALTGPQSCNLNTAVRQKLLQRSRQSTRRSCVLSRRGTSRTSNERDILKNRYRYSYLAMFFPDLPKESGRFDLPIALGILIASGQIQAPMLDEHEFAGELALSGELRPIRGALAMCAAIRQQAHRRAFILPRESAPEAALIGDMSILPAGSLLEVCAHLNGMQALAPSAVPPAPTFTHYPDLAEVRGQAKGKRALEVAAAGGHSLLMSGSPGAGKSMLAQRLPGILPPLTQDEALAAAAVQSLAGQFRLERFGVREVRAPHHTSSAPALVGGGNPPHPGEISLAHEGVLFLDELPEFDRRVLEALREPLESGHIHVARAARRAEFPARFQLVAAMNPCPCGWQSHANGKCRCTPDQVARYRGKLSGPFLDRIDLLLEIPVVGEAELAAREPGETSATVRARVIAARTRQMQRQGKPNARLSVDEIERHALPDAEGAALLKQAMAQLGFSARAYHRILKVARSIADLAGSPTVGRAHVAEAVHYRRGLSH